MWAKACDTECKIYDGNLHLLLCSDGMSRNLWWSNSAWGWIHGTTLLTGVGVTHVWQPDAKPLKDEERRETLKGKQIEGTLLMTWDQYSGEDILKMQTQNAMDKWAPRPISRYHRTIKGVQLDVYDILTAYSVTCPARQHAIKKLLMAGERGHKDTATDLGEAVGACRRAAELAEDRHEN